MTESKNKMSMERFKEIKKQLDTITKKALQVNENEEIDWNNETFKDIEDSGFEYLAEKGIISEEELKVLEEIHDEIEESDLGDIPFEEWDGFIDLGFDFENSNANLDFNLIHEELRGTEEISLKGCNIKNFDFDKIPYDEAYSFDEKFMQNHKEHFWGLSKGENLPPDIRKKIPYWLVNN